jgi:nicotinamide phosphoribosyltransferase
MCDGYAQSHWEQLPPNSKKVFSYLESRGGIYDYLVFYEIQAFIKKYLLNPLTMEDMYLFESFMNNSEDGYATESVTFNQFGWTDVIKKCGGYLPIQIKSLPEGIVVGTKNVLISIENTHDDFAWVVWYVETMLLRSGWYGSTVATLSYHIKQDILNYLELSGTPESIDNKLCDFGARSVSSRESAMIGGSAHLLNFIATDTIEGKVFAKKYYGGKVLGTTIFATQHNSHISYGKENELLSYETILDKFQDKKNCLVAIVIDSYNDVNAIKMFGTTLKEKVINIYNNGGMVFLRPDSGLPTRTVLKVIKTAEKYFGCTVNEKGFKVLNFVRIIQGDGINRKMILKIMDMLIQHNYSIDNISFGMGSALLAHPQRDDLMFALKSSWIEFVDGSTIEFRKDPKSAKSKSSKAGRLAVIREDGVIKTIREDCLNGRENLLRTVFLNGILMVDEDFMTIKERLNNSSEI